MRGIVKDVIISIYYSMLTSSVAMEYTINRIMSDVSLRTYCQRMYIIEYHDIY